MPRKSIHRRFWEKVQVRWRDQCWPWTASVTHGGYGRFRRGRSHIHAHRLSYIFNSGKEIPDCLIVRHICDNPACCNPAHLLLGTHKQNTQDMYDRNRAAIGERNGYAKLTEKDVRAIRADNTPSPKIAAKFGVRASTIRKIRRCERWVHVD